MADNLNVPLNVSTSPAHMQMDDSQLCRGVFNPISDDCGKIQTNFLKPEIHVEILQQNTSTLPSENVVLLAFNALKSLSSLVEDVVLHEFDDPEVKQHIKSISLNISSPNYDQSICIGESQLIYHTFRLNTDAEDTESIESEGVSAATYWILPAEDFHGSWENLIYDTDIKSYLLNFVSKSLLFAERKVDSNVITWNKVVLLHGPPGTGKTSLCRALAQKLCIRLSDKYKYGQLIEINSHSLFSKWFSESGKLVMKMFLKIQEIIDDPEALVFVLIDEVESLAHCRQASLGGAEPSDSLRVVNALLTQLDKIKTYPNVVILTTSNITEAIDTALIDRADIRHYIGLPSVAAIYQIYSSCIKELQRTKLIYTKEAILPCRILNMCGSEMTQCSLKLKKISEQSEGLSGRSLRKLPFLAFALYIKTSSTLDDFLDALSKAVTRQFQETEDMKLKK